MSIQEDVIETIGEGIAVAELYTRIDNIGKGALDCCLNALERTGKVIRKDGRLTLRDKRPNQKRDFVPAEAVGQGLSKSQQRRFAAQRVTNTIEAKRQSPAPPASVPPAGEPKAGVADSQASRKNVIPTRVITAVESTAPLSFSIEWSGCATQPGPLGLIEEIPVWWRIEPKVHKPLEPTPGDSGPVVIVSEALDNAKAVRRETLGRIAELEKEIEPLEALQVRLEKEKARLEGCERFIELYREFEE